MSKQNNAIVEFNGKFYIVWSFIQDVAEAVAISDYEYDTLEAAQADLPLTEECDSLAGIYSDAHKDAYGFRDRTPFKAGVTLQQKISFYKEELDRLSEVIAQQVAQEEIEQAKNVETFETCVERTMMICNCDRDDAIRHIMVAENCDSRSELNYVLGLPFRYLTDVELSV